MPRRPLSPEDLSKEDYTIANISVDPQTASSTFSTENRSADTPRLQMPPKVSAESQLTQDLYAGNTHLSARANHMSQTHLSLNTQDELQDNLVHEIHKVRGYLEDALNKNDAQELAIRTSHEKIASLNKECQYLRKEIDEYHKAESQTNDSWLKEKHKLERVLSESQDALSQQKRTTAAHVRELGLIEASKHRLENEVLELRTSIRDRDTKLTLADMDRKHEQDILDEMLQSAQEQLSIIENLEQQNSALSDRLALAEERCIDIHQPGQIPQQYKADAIAWKRESRSSSSSEAVVEVLSQEIRRVRQSAICVTGVPAIDVTGPTSSSLSLSEELTIAFGDKCYSASEKLEKIGPYNGSVLPLSGQHASDMPVQNYLETASGAFPRVRSHENVLISVGTQTFETVDHEHEPLVRENESEKTLCECHAANLLPIALREIAIVKGIILNNDLSISQRVREIEKFYPDCRASICDTVDEIDASRESSMFRLEGYDGISEARFQRISGPPYGYTPISDARVRSHAMTSSSVEVSLSEGSKHEMIRTDSPVLGKIELHTTLCQDLYWKAELPTNHNKGVPPRRNSLWPLNIENVLVDRGKLSQHILHKADDQHSQKSVCGNVSQASLVSQDLKRQTATEETRTTSLPNPPEVFKYTDSTTCNTQCDTFPSNMRAARQALIRSEISSSSTYSSVTGLRTCRESSEAPQPDPMIEKMTHCVIGTEMYKYVRTQKKSIFGVNRKTFEDRNYRHKRFISLKPNDGTICWSSSRQSGRVLGLRRCHIEEVFDVEDSTPVAPGQVVYGRSLLIVSGKRSLKFTAHDETTHRTWFEVISYLLQQRKSAVRSNSVGSLKGVSVARSRGFISSVDRGRSSSVTSRMTARPAPIARERPSMPDLPLAIASTNYSTTTEDRLSRVQVPKARTASVPSITVSPDSTTSSQQQGDSKFKDSQMTLRAGMASPMSTKSAIVSAVTRNTVLSSTQTRRAASMNARTHLGTERVLSAFIT